MSFRQVSSVDKPIAIPCTWLSPWPPLDLAEFPCTVSVTRSARLRRDTAIGGTDPDISNQQNTSRGQDRVKWQDAVRENRQDQELVLVDTGIL